MSRTKLVTKTKTKTNTNTDPRTQVAKVGVMTSTPLPKPKRVKAGGRTKGTPNKLGKTCKENIVAVFTRLGGTAEMAKWAKENQTEFYRIYAKLLPIEVSGPGGNPIQLEVLERDTMRGAILAAAAAVEEEVTSGKLH